MGNSLNDTIQGCAGSDTLDGSTGDTSTTGDSLVGTGGNDTFIIHNIHDQIVENGDSGTVLTYTNFTLVANVQNLVIKDVSTDLLCVTGYSAGGDSIVGASYATNGGDTLSDSSGNTNNGADTLIGKGGNDTFVVYNPGDVVSEKVAPTGLDIIKTYTGFSLVANVSNLKVMDTIATDYISTTGNIAGGDSILGGANNGTGGGDCISDIYGVKSADTLHGQSGNDTFIVYNTGDNVIENAGFANNQVQSYVNFTLTSDVESLTLEDTAKGHYAMGFSFGDSLTGCHGHDTLDGSSNDTASGISNNAGDTLTGLGGNDTFIVYNYNDKVVEDGSNPGTILYDYVGSADSTTPKYTMTANITSLTIEDSLTGHYIVGNSSGGNIIISASANNAGGDTLSDNSGLTCDTLKGEGGNDTFIVYNSADVVTESGGNNGSILYYATSDPNAAYVLSNGIKYLTIEDTSHTHFIIGNSSNSDSIVGNAASDILATDYGYADTLVGQSGADTFITQNSGDIIKETGSGTSIIEAYGSYDLTHANNNIQLLIIQ